jgi:hypothetical protein
MCPAFPVPTVSTVQVYEIRIAGGDDVLKERVARMLCPEENHPPPCPVPWSFGYDEDAVVLAIYAEPDMAEQIAADVRALTARPVEITVGTPENHEELITQHRIESRRR